MFFGTQNIHNHILALFEKRLPTQNIKCECAAVSVQILSRLPWSCGPVIHNVKTTRMTRITTTCSHTVSKCPIAIRHEEHFTCDDGLLCQLSCKKSLRERTEGLKGAWRWTGATDQRKKSLMNVLVLAIWCVNCGSVFSDAIISVAVPSIWSHTVQITARH